MRQSSPAASRVPAPVPHGDPIIRICTAIERWNASSEQVYLSAGEQLQALHRKVAQVREGIARSTELFEGEEMRAVRVGLTSAADEAGVINALTLDRTLALQDLRTAVDAASAGSSAVLLIFRLLDYVVLIARAQVEGMSEGHDELGPFTQHVDELVGSGEEVARYIDERMHLLQRYLTESRSLETVAASDGGGSGMVKGFLQLAASLEDQQRSAALQREKAHAAFTAIWKAIGGIVMGLQFHDNARQRLEHTIDNLRHLRRIQETGRISDDLGLLSEAGCDAAVRRIAALEIAQLDELSNGYHAKMAEIDANLGRIGEESVESGAVLQRLQSGDSSQQGLAVLDAEASRLRAGFKRGGDVRVRLRESLSQCVEATSSLIEMTEKLADLEHNLRIAGFNAAVRAAHVDNGDETIGYIARVIREQASLAREDADRVRDGIEHAVSSTNELAGRILPEIATAESGIEERLTSATSELARIEGECTRELKSAMTVAQGIGPDVGKIRDMMRPHIEGCELMRALSASLEAIVSQVPDGQAADDLSELDRLLSCRYTMEEERAVFAAILGGPLRAVSKASGPAAVVDDLPAPGSSEDLDDILF